MQFNFFVHYSRTIQPLLQHIAAKSTDLKLSKNTRFSEIAVKGSNSPIEAFSLLRDIFYPKSNFRGLTDHFRASLFFSIIILINFISFNIILLDYFYRFLNFLLKILFSICFYGSADQMSLCDCRGHCANGKEMTRRHSVSKEPQACLRANRLYKVSVQTN